MATPAVTEPDLNLERELAEHLIQHDGELGARHGIDPRIPLLRDHALPGTVTQVPRSVHRSLYGYQYGMLANDTIGDCVIAAQYHAIMHSRVTSGRTDAPKADAVTPLAINAYSAITGYTPSDPASDQGTDPTQAWAYWQTTGLPLPDGSLDKIAGSVQIAPADGVNLRRAIYEFDNAGLSLAMPAAWQGASRWDLSGDPVRDSAWQPGSWGGHEVLAVSVDSRWIAVVTWGGIKLLSWRAWGVYGQIALSQVSHDQIGRTGVSETGLNYDTLLADLPQL